MARAPQTFILSHNIRARERLLEDEHVRRWHRNVARGSPITAEVALRRLSRLSELLKMSPKGMVESARNDLAKFQDMLEDMVAELEDEGRAPGYIEDLMKTIKSWLRYHDITLTRRIKIKNQTATPTIENEQIPSQEELARILRASPPRIRAAIALIAFADLRPQILGNHDGSDGLRIRDLPEMRIEKGQVTFEKKPTMVVVRSSLSKAKHRYFTFLSSEGCTYLKEYLEERIRNGEELKPESPLIAHERSELASKPFEPILGTAAQPLEQTSVVKEAKIEALKSIAKSLLGMDLTEVKVAMEQKLNRQLTPEEEITLFENEIKKWREKKEDPQRIVEEEELETHLSEGWEFVSVLPSGRILVRRAKNVSECGKI